MSGEVAGICSKDGYTSLETVGSREKPEVHSDGCDEGRLHQDEHVTCPSQEPYPTLTCDGVFATMMPISTPKPAKENRTTSMMEQVFEFRDLAFAWEFMCRLGFDHAWGLSQNNFLVILLIRAKINEEKNVRC